MVMIARTITEVRRIFPDANCIWEEENKFWVELPNKAVTIVLKPRKKEAIRDILIENLFPRKAVEVVLSEIKMTEAVKQIKNKNSVVIEGPVGTGKTTACIWRIAKMLQRYEINNPLYIGLATIEDELVKNFQQYDAYLIDDLSPNTPQLLRLAERVIYHAEGVCKPLFLTLNNKKVLELFDEPILSRLVAHCEFLRVDGEDLRVKSLLEKKQQAEIKK